MNIDVASLYRCRRVSMAGQSDFVLVFATDFVKLSHFLGVLTHGSSRVPFRDGGCFGKEEGGTGRGEGSHHFQGAPFLAGQKAVNQFFVVGHWCKAGHIHTACNDGVGPPRANHFGGTRHGLESRGAGPSDGVARGVVEAQIERNFSGYIWAFGYANDGAPDDVIKPLGSDFVLGEQFSGDLSG